MTRADVSHAPRRTRRRRRLILAVLGSLLFVLLVCATWLGARASIAKSELEAVVPLAARLADEAAAGVLESHGAVSEIAGHAEQAASLTSDPIWRGAEWVPVLGPNLTAFRELAGAVKLISDDAVGPLVDLASTGGLGGFKPNGGEVDFQPLIEARTEIDRASAAVEAAKHTVASINTAATVVQIRAAQLELGDQLNAVSAPLQAAQVAAALLPDMLGSSEPRRYLLLVQNPAELRASGGISGALALLQADKGRIQLVQQASTVDFPRFDSPVLPLTDEVRGLYGDKAGEYIQNVNLMPHFPRSAALAREMWKERFGAEVDGVLSIDPVALSYILEATGSVTLATGDLMSAANAVTLLLRDAYTRYPIPRQQDAFFAAAASAVFDRISSGEVDSGKLVGALMRAGEERRVNVWSARESEQEVLSATSIAGGLPVRTEDVLPFGVYLNDATAAKMDFYLDVQIDAGQVTCRGDGRPNYGVEVTLTNTAPAGAENLLPTYVTGEGAFGVTPGNIKTIVNVYGAEGLQNLGVARDGVVAPYLPATDLGYQVSQIAVELVPGESATLEFGFLGDKTLSVDLVIDQTPVINLHETKKLALSCESPLW